ncbi:PilX N-terminal domain-containing pilus assembly protein [Acinetobacter sp. 226]|uniref:PilX N-terminal domain-containing pilus assembly protein n=1 Tax=Acinetobacter sp. 226 TaxID=3114699 RepID=UPI003A889E51
MKKYLYERGSTLIVVLILLVLISVIGLYAMRHSILNLKLATNAQVQTMLMQTTDVALDHLEKHFNDNEQAGFSATPIGQVLLDGNQGKELQFCFKPTEIDSDDELTDSVFFSLRDFRIITRKAKDDIEAATSVESGSYDATCDPTTMFSISRKALVTQVTVVNPDDPTVELGRFALTTKKTDLKDVNIETKRVRVTVTSLAPALAPSVDIDDMQDCLQQRMMDEKTLKNMEITTEGQVKVQTVHECLNNLGVPVNTQVSEYIVNLAETRSPVAE